MPSAARTYVSFANFSQVREAGLVVAACLHAEQVRVVSVGTYDVLPLTQRLVGDHLDAGADGPDRASFGTERLADLPVLGRPEVLAQHGQELHLVESVVAAHEREHDPAVRDD